jgi:aspartate-semialdehyde dehydrogenase
MHKINIAVLGLCRKDGFAWIAQSILYELHNHPFFNVVAAITDKGYLQGKSLRDGLENWYEERPFPHTFSELPILPPNGEYLRDTLGVGLVISSLPPKLSYKLDLQLAASNLPVVSESPGLRAEPDIPLITPEINANHLNIIHAQRNLRSWNHGFVISNPGCTYTILALALKPILDKAGITGAIITTMQAISGAGPEAIPGMNIIDNVIPYIPNEESKLAQELPKILGDSDGEKIIPLEIALSATCCRVPVLDGHTAVVTL